MKRIVFVSLFLALAVTAVFAKGLVLDDATKEICNRVIVDIYRDILASQKKYKDLAAFSEKCFYENKRGIYAIVYEAPASDKDLSEPNQRKIPYSFGITIEGLEDNTFGQHDGAFAFGFPLLGLKISGYQQRRALRSQFDVLPLIQKYGGALENHQQNYLPLRLVLRPLKETYQVKEDIEFEVVLVNISKRNMLVKPLDRNNMFFYIDDKFAGQWLWGDEGQASSRADQLVTLYAGESLRMVVKGESFQYPKEVVVRAVYRMEVENVNPAGELRLRIVGGASKLLEGLKQKVGAPQ